MKPLAPNNLLQNRYLIVQLIGKGGMGEVYLAVDQRLGSAVALKRTFFSDDEMLGTAFEREARTLARLRHPVLPKVSDHFTENETQYLVMEHITGDDLAKRLEITNKPFPLNWVLFWADQLLDALAYLHSHEPPIVHRDIKPQNLKLTDENHIVLLDFGLAKNAIGNTRVSSTTGGSIVGYTPHYAPMEQVRGTGTDPRSDIYSFSATFYQLLTNAVPPDAITRADAVINGSSDPTKHLYEINAEVPRAISEVIIKGMSLGMDQRYQSAREMQKALREAYSQVQNQMAAQTMAFNAADIQGNSSAPVQQLSTNVAGQNAPASNTVPTAYDSVAGMSGVNSADILTPPMDAPPPPLNVNSAPVSQQEAGFKTEVIPAEMLPRPENYKTPSSGEDFSSVGNQKFDSLPRENKSSQLADDFFDFGDEVSKEDDFDPNATIPPLVSFGNAGATAPPPVPNYDSINDDYSSASGADDLQPEDDFRSEEHRSPVTEPPLVEEKPPTVVPASAPVKKSGGKALAVAGGIAALFVILAVVGVGAWYALSGGGSAAAKPSPTPAAEPTAAPTIAPTVEPTLETNIGNTNTETDITSATPEPTTVDNSNSQRTGTTVEKPTAPTNPGDQKTAPTPRVATAKTPPPKKATPAKTPPKVNRTDVY